MKPIKDPPDRHAAKIGDVATLKLRAYENATSVMAGPYGQITYASAAERKPRWWMDCGWIGTILQRRIRPGCVVEVTIRVIKEGKRERNPWWFKDMTRFLKPAELRRRLEAE
jgi:hypothetical protein